MLGFNDEFKNGKTRITRAWLDITLSDSTVLNLDESRVMFNGLTRDTSTTMDGEFTVGAAVTTKLTVSLDNSDNSLDAYDFRGAVIVAWLGGTLTSGTVQKVNIGRYNVSEYSYDGSCINLVALDDLCKFDIRCDQTLAWVSGKSIADLVNLACAAATIDLYNASLPGPSGYRIIRMPEQWETMTWHDVIAYCAQIMGCFVHMVYVPNPGTWKLKFDWYDMGSLTPSQFDGGTYDTTTTPYSDGATLDGGSFDPWNTGDVADGGTFHDRDNLIILPAPYDMTIDTDDVMITGVTVTLDPSDNVEATDDTKTYTTSIAGSAGYVINIEGNPLIETTAQADTVAVYLGSLINGMRFRPMTISAIEDPSLEAGDVAFITDRNGNVYAIFLSHVAYTVNASTQISCDAQTTMQNLKSRYSGAQKTRAMIQRSVEKTASDAENAMSGIIGALATTMGLYKFEETAPDGGTIYKFGDAQTLAQSTKIWRFSAGALTVSNDGGTTWSGALTADGIAVLQELYAVKVNADLIEAGAFTTKDSLGNETFYADTATGVVRINAQSVSITGRTVDNIAQGYATTAENNAKTAAQGYANTAETNAVNTASADATAKANAAELNAKNYSDAELASWVTNTYDPDKTTLQNQIDEKIETWYQASDPSSSWSDNTIKAKHVGDLWYCSASTGTYAGKYWQYTYESGTYSWKELKATPPTGVMDEIDGKANIFTGATTPSGAEEGDLWFKGTSEPILTYVSGQWVEYNRYTAEINAKVGSFYQEADPSLAWTTTTDKAAHVGDIWYCSADPSSAIPNWLSNYVNTDEGLTALATTRIDDGWRDTANAVNFPFDGVVSSNAYINSNSFIKFADTQPSSTGASQTANVHVCSRDGQSLYIGYQVVDAGTSGKALKIKYKGYTRYQTTYQLPEYKNEYEIFFLDSGSIILNQIAVPTNTTYIGDCRIVDNNVTVYFNPITGVTAFNKVDSSWVPSGYGYAQQYWQWVLDGQTYKWQAIDISAEKIKELDASLDQQGVFDRLTDNKANQGIYLDNGNLYINASMIGVGTITSSDGSVEINLDDNTINIKGVTSFTNFVEQDDLSTAGSTEINGSNIKSGTITLGGSNNQNGVLEVKNASGTRVCRIDNTGYYYGNIATSLTNNSLQINTSGEVIAHSNVVTTKIDHNGITYYATDGTNIGDFTIYGISSSGSDRSTVRCYNSNGKIALSGTAGTYINGYLISGNPKARLIDTENYGNRLLFCYETPTPLFGDVGTGRTDENGEAVISIDDMFSETISGKIEYSVFLQKEGQGDIWVDEKDPLYFVVKGTPNLKFSWEIKIVQIGADDMRLVDDDIRLDEVVVDEPIGLNLDQDLYDLDNESLFDDDFFA